MRYSGPVHFRYGEGSAAAAELESLARVYLGKLRARLRGVPSGALIRSGPGWQMRVAFVYGQPVVDISTTAGEIDIESARLRLYLESAVADIQTWNVHGVDAESVPILTRVAQASHFKPDGRLEFNERGAWRFRDIEEGQRSKIFGKRVFDAKARRFTPASVFSGKLKLLVQSLYGSKRTDFDGSSGAGVVWGSAFLSPSFPHGSILVTTPKRNYWLLRVTSNGVYARPLTLSRAGGMLRHAIRSGRMEATAGEAYLFGQARPHAREVLIPSSGLDAIAGGPIAYGWHATQDGLRAQAVCLTTTTGGLLSASLAQLTITVLRDTVAGNPAEWSACLRADCATFGASAGKIKADDLLIAPLGTSLIRILDSVGDAVCDFPVYGYYDRSDIWREVRYQNTGTLHGFACSGVSYLIDASPARTVDTHILDSSVGFTVNRIVGDSEYTAYGLNIAPGAYDGPYPDNLNRTGWWGNIDYDTSESGVLNYTLGESGLTLALIPHFDCSAIYMGAQRQRAMSGISSQRGTANGMIHALMSPRLYSIASGSPAYISDGNPPDSRELGMSATTDYPPVDWQVPLVRQDSKNGHGFVVTGSATLNEQWIDYFGADFQQTRVMSASELPTSSLSAQEGVQIPGFAIQYSPVAITSGLVSYLTDINTLSPTVGAIGDPVRWAPVWDINLSAPFLDAVVQSYSAVRDSEFFARIPNGDAYEFAEGDVPRNFRIIGWK